MTDQKMERAVQDFRTVSLSLEPLTRSRKLLIITLLEANKTEMAAEGRMKLT